MKATIAGGPAPYRESLTTRLTERGHVFDDAPAQNGERYVVIVYCDSADRWAELAERAGDPDQVVVAVIVEINLQLYIRALLDGAAGVIYSDSPTALMADTIHAAIQGEVSLPRQAAQSIAALARREEAPNALDAREAELLKAVASGTTIVALADQLYYSERTVRRHLQSLYLKLGVKNRTEAIAAASRLGIV